MTVTRPENDLIIAVRDTGVGIPQDRIAGLFDKFVQADLSTTRQFGGTGLGLAICQELVCLMKGHIEVESALSQGSTFKVFLPLERISGTLTKSQSLAAQVAPKVEADSAVDLRILAAEDNHVNQVVLKTLLLQAGIDVTIVEDGQLALDAWRSQAWDLILMDIQMPRMDGPTAVALIRKEELATGRPRTPIIALTANTLSYQVDDYLKAGMDLVVAKPIQIDRLFDAMGQMLDPPEATTKNVA